MKQIIFKDGSANLIDVPTPVVLSKSILIKVVNSCISAGTELSSMIGTKDGLIKRALKQPEKIIKASAYLKDEGLIKTIDMIKSKKNIVESSGYSVSGIVIGIGDEVDGFKIGDPVAAAGENAVHAEFVEVPKNLVVKVPKNLDLSLASTVALGSIALHAVRRADVKLGEFIAVYGVGLIGQIITKLLTLNGARVFSLDINNSNLDLANSMGAERIFNVKDSSLKNTINSLTNNNGVDKLIFAASTVEDSALSNAFSLIRKKGKLVMVGTWGDKLNRRDIYNKEIDFSISTSYGLGRYDSNYEQKGIDYPYHLVRWTQNRNMEEYLRLLKNNSLLDNLSKKTYHIKNVEKAFESISSNKSSNITFLEYNKIDIIEDQFKLKKNENLLISPKIKKINSDKIRVGIIGAGSFVSQVHLPNLKKMNETFDIISICNKTGLSAKLIADKFSVKNFTSNSEEIFNNPNIDLVMICTRHNLHGDLVLKGLESGKNIFVEKPLCTKNHELQKIKEFFKNNQDPPFLMVGYNRRYSPFAVEIKKQLNKRNNPLIINYQMNADYLPNDHWVYDEDNGGRIIGEACHIIDLCSFFINSPIKSVNTNALSDDYSLGSDDINISIAYDDGSMGIINYFTNASSQLSKERFEIHFDGKSILVDDYKKIQTYGLKIKRMNYKTPEKGLTQELEYIKSCLIDKSKKIDINNLFETTALTFSIK